MKMRGLKLRRTSKTIAWADSQSNYAIVSDLPAFFAYHVVYLRPTHFHWHFKKKVYTTYVARALVTKRFGPIGSGPWSPDNQLKTIKVSY